MRRGARTQVSFTVTILTAFALVFLAAIAIVVMGYRRAGGEAATQTAEQALDLAATGAAAATQGLVGPVVLMAEVMAETAPLVGALRPEGRDAAALLTLLAAASPVQSVSLGLGDGTLRQAARAAGMHGPEAPPVPPGSAFMLREVAPEGLERWLFLGADARVLGTLERPATGADPRATSWYRQARDGHVHVSTLHDLPLPGRPGLSVSRRVPGIDAVLALDLTLETLADFLRRQRPSANSVLFLFNDIGMLLAHQRPALAVRALDNGMSTWTTMAASPDPLLRAVWREFASGRIAPGTTARIDLDGAVLLARLDVVGALAEPQMMVAVVAPVADFTGPIDAGLRTGTALALVTLTAGLIALGIVAWRMARPLAALTREAEAIRWLELEGEVPVASRITEIASLAAAMDGMKAALRVFGVYVPRDLVGRLIREGMAARIGGERRPITVMFSDVENFTTLAEGMQPETLMQVVSAYFQALTDALMNGRATIDKYIGDGVMALWNAPRDDPAHAADACRAVLAARRASEAMAPGFAARGWPQLHTRFGLHTGEAVVGNVGSTDRMSYTAIGSMVNIAARLEGLNKHYGTRILLSEATRVAAGPDFLTRPVDLVLVKGASQPMEIHELIGIVGSDAPEAAPARLASWSALVAAWRAGRFAEARAALDDLPPAVRDPLAVLYRCRLEEIAAAPPGPGWSPVTRFATK